MEYLREVERHYEVLDKRLKGRGFIVGDSLTIVDIAAWGWVDRSVPALGGDRLAEFAEVNRWFRRINDRHAVTRARSIGKDHDFKTSGDEASRRALYPSNYAAE